VTDEVLGAASRLIKYTVKSCEEMLNDLSRKDCCGELNLETLCV